MPSSSNASILKMIRILKLPKLARILDPSNFDKLLENILENSSR
jgi:hypothetical protein